MRVRSCSVVLALAWLFAGRGVAQPAPQAPPAAKNADTVRVFFTVDDGHGKLVPNLSKDSFQVREDGRPQAIQEFAPAQGLPLTLGILVDTSGVMQGALPAEKAAADSFLHQVVTAKDLAFVLSFDVTVDLLQDLTSDTYLLHSGLEKARVNIGLRSVRSGGALHDAVYLASGDILKNQIGRKALVILTGGVDQGSKVKLKDAILAAQKADAVCYVVLFFHSLFGQPANELAEQTGGRLITVNSVDKLQQALSQITDELRNQYSLSYASDNTKHDGGFHAIDVTCKEGYKVRTRKGYYAPGQ